MIPRPVAATRPPLDEKLSALRDDPSHDGAIHVCFSQNMFRDPRKVDNDSGGNHINTGARIPNNEATGIIMNAAGS